LLFENPIWQHKVLTRWPPQQEKFNIGTYGEMLKLQKKNLFPLSSFSLVAICPSTGPCSPDLILTFVHDLLILNLVSS
jgi:hypothetical protein